jgi:hypothetical protein
MCCSAYSSEASDLLIANNGIQRADHITREGVEDKQLAIRVPDLKTANSVRMGETKFFSFGLLSKSYGSKAFGNCIGVLVAGNKGAIISHYTVSGTTLGVPVPNDPLDTHITLANDNAAAVKIPALFTANLNAFKDGLEVFIYTVANADGSLMFPQEVNNLAQVLATAIGVQPTIVHYSKATAGKAGGQMIVTNKITPGYTT